MRRPAAWHGAPAVPVPSATGSFQTLVSPQATNTSYSEVVVDEIMRGMPGVAQLSGTSRARPEQEQLAPLLEGGASGSQGHPADQPGRLERQAVAEEEERGDIGLEDARSPSSPSRAEREAHEATHFPFRSWCAACVRGRSDNLPRPSLPAGGEEER